MASEAVVAAPILHPSHMYPITVAALLCCATMIITHLGAICGILQRKSKAVEGTRLRAAAPTQQNPTLRHGRADERDLNEASLQADFAQLCHVHAQLCHVHAFGPILSMLPTADEIMLVVDKCIETDRRPLHLTCKALNKLLARRKRPILYSSLLTSSDGASIQRLQWLRSLGTGWIPDEEYSADTTSAAIACYGELHVLEWAHANGCPIDHRTAKAAAKAGRIDTLEWLSSRVTLEDERHGLSGLLFSAAQSGKLDVVQWVLRLGGEPLFRRHGQLVLLGAAEAGSLALLEWAFTNGARDGKPMTRSVCEDANGNLSVLRWARARGFEWTNGHAADYGPMIVASFLKRGGDLDGLRWLLDNGCPFDPKATCMQVAASLGNLDMMRLLRERGCPWIGEVHPERPWMLDSPIESAAQSGHLHVILWAIKNGCPRGYKDAEIRHAVFGGHLNIIKWLHAHGTPLTASTMRAAASFGRPAILEWLHAHHCPWDDPDDVRYGNTSSQAALAAVESGSLRTVQFVAAHAPDWDLLACLSMALKSNYDHIVEWLLSEHLLPTLRNTDPIFHCLSWDSRSKLCVSTVVRPSTNLHGNRLRVSV